MQQWQLPDRIRRIVAHHRAPDLNDAQDVNAAVVHLASWRARAIESQMSEDDQIKYYPVNVGKALGIEPVKIVQWIPAGTK